MESKLVDLKAGSMVDWSGNLSVDRMVEMMVATMVDS
jgi:hypothetical protein